MNDYVLAAYVIGIGMMWGYAALLLLKGRKARRGQSAPHQSE